MRKLGLNFLYIVLTENCDLQCAHCMRGDRNPKSMSPEMLDLIFSNINRIGYLNITGGEPLMRADLLKVLTDKLEEHKVIVGQFGIITNGTYYNDEILKQLERLDKLTTHYGIPALLTRFNGDGIESCELIDGEKVKNSIYISSDKFHDAEIRRLGIDELRTRNTLLYKKWCEQYNIDFDFQTIADETVKNIGRAQSLNMNKKDDKYIYFAKKYVETHDIKYLIYCYDWCRDIHYDVNYISGQLEINPYGYVSQLGDASFEDIQKYNIGNLMDNTLFDMVNKVAQLEIEYLLESIEKGDYSLVKYHEKNNIPVLVKNLKLKQHKK